jgi:hypothetical protein
MNVLVLKRRHTTLLSTILYDRNAAPYEYMMTDSKIYILLLKEYCELVGRQGMSSDLRLDDGELQEQQSLSNSLLYCVALLRRAKLSIYLGLRMPP